MDAVAVDEEGFAKFVTPDADVAGGDLPFPEEPLVDVGGGTEFMRRSLV